MAFSLGRLSIFSLLALWLACTINWTNAAPNFLAHCYEKLYLWEMYNTACDIQTPANQNLILPFSKQKGQETTNNKGSGENERLTYNEFMARISNKPLPTELSLLEPDDMDKAAQNLMDNKLGAALDTSNINKKKLMSDTKGAYAKLFRECDQDLTKWRLSTNTETANKAASRLDNMKELSTRIVAARREDSKTFMISLLAKPVDKGGLGLGDDNVVTEEKKSQFESKKNYETVNFDKTFQKNADALKDTYGTRKKLKAWVDSVIKGDIVVEGDESTRSHAAAKTLWEDLAERNALTNERLASIPRPGGVCKK